MFNALLEWAPQVWSSVIIALVTAVIAYITRRIIKHQEQRIVTLHKKPETIEKARTRFDMMKRLILPLIYFIGLMTIAFQFESIRKLGAGFFASAGIIGIIVGLAARSTLANLVAGIMISFSQPVRIGDTVVIGDEYGVIEEITLMYTYFRTWDNRRVIIPNEILANREIINYTIRDKSLLTKLILYVDYTADLPKVKKILIEKAKQSKYTRNGEEPTFWVKNLTDHAMELWLLVWAEDAPSAWKQACEIREAVLAEFRKEGIHLPRHRLQIEPKGVDL